MTTTLRVILGRRAYAATLIAWVLSASAALAQSGGSLAIVSSVIGAGGTTATGSGAALRVTIGQFDAAHQGGGTFTLTGGFLGEPVAGESPTPSPTLAGTLTPTVAPSASVTGGPLPSVTVPPPTATMTVVPTLIPTATNTANGTQTRTVLPTHTPTASPIPSVCIGNCNTDDRVTVDEVLMMVDIALGTADPSTCETRDANHDGAIAVDEILAAVNNAFRGCPTP